MKNIYNKIIVEVCVSTIKEAVLAEQQGANRIEFCKNLNTGGLTPDLNVIKKALKTVSIPIKVMIRPHSKGFIYSKFDLNKMIKNINEFQSIGIKEVVFGILTNDHKIDEKNTSDLASHASPMVVTFHKAIDQTKNLIDSIHILKRIEGVNSILSSGGMPTALKGAKLLKKMSSICGKNLSIIAAGKITKSNLETVHGAIKCNEYHGRRILN